MRFTAVGDILCQRKLPEGYKGFREVKDFIARGDARFFNLENTVNYEDECYACQHSGGTYVRCTAKEIGEKTGVNAEKNILIREGYCPFLPGGSVRSGRCSLFAGRTGAFSKLRTRRTWIGSKPPFGKPGLLPIM